MLHENNINIESLILNESFQRWVLKNTPTDALYWNAWIERNSEHIDTVLQAREIILTLHAAQFSVSEQEVETEINRLTHTLQIHTDSEAKQNKKTVHLWQQIGFRIAASIVLVLATGITYWYVSSKPVVSTAYQQTIEKAVEPLQEVSNQTDKSRLINLPDGSTVILSPNSRLSYPRKFAREKREVYLQGEGFFEVTKKPEQPFLVHANELISKVLGTSFTIRAFEQDAKVKVIIKTGKVSVYSEKSHSQVIQHQRKELNGLILTPNQQLVFNRQDNQMIRTLVEEPAVIDTHSIQQQRFSFNKTAITEVFRILQQTYGVSIVYNEELVNGCELTGELGDEPLLEKMRLICSAIDGTYEMTDGQIIVNNKGCK